MEFPTPRSIDEIVIDRLLLLYMVDYLRKQGYSIRGTDFQKMLKINKLLYFVESRMNEKQIKSYNYHFRKWDSGPLAQEAYLDVNHLHSSDLIKFGTVVNMKTEGKLIADNIQDILVDENETLICIERVVREYGQYRWDKIKNAVYAFPVLGEKIRMDRVKKGTPILNKLESSDSTISVTINPDWVDTVKILLSPSVYHSIQNGISALKTDSGEDFDDFVKTLRLR